MASCFSFLLLGLLVTLIMTQTPEMIYSFDFSTKNGWTVGGSGVIIASASSGNCPTSNNACWYMSRGGEGWGYRDYSLVGYHSIQVIIDIRNWDTDIGEYCRVRYSTPSSGWQILYNFPGNGQDELRSDIVLDLPNDATVNNQSAFTLEMRANIDQDFEYCMFDNLEIWGISYTNTNPTGLPTNNPSNNPTTNAPTMGPTNNPSVLPTNNPTKYPTTLLPTALPTKYPTDIPSITPTVLPTYIPSISPTNNPTGIVLSTQNPADITSIASTGLPTVSPNDNPDGTITTTDGNDGQVDPEETITTPNEKDEHQLSSEENDTYTLWIALILVFGCVFIAVIAVVIYVKKKKEKQRVMNLEVINPSKHDQQTLTTVKVNSEMELGEMYSSDRKIKGGGTILDAANDTEGNIQKTNDSDSENADELYGNDDITNQFNHQTPQTPGMTAGNDHQSQRTPGI